MKMTPTTHHKLPLKEMCIHYYTGKDARCNITVSLRTSLLSYLQSFDDLATSLGASLFRAKRLVLALRLRFVRF
jgi:hypothetical protein